MNGGFGLGNRLGMGGGGGVVISVTEIFTDSNIVRTFSEEVQPATVTNVGDGSGSYEVFNDTAAAWVAGALSTSDNIQWTFNPTADFTIGDSITLHLKDTILTVVGGNPYEGPFEVKYLVVNRPPIFSVQPVINTELYDGGTFDFTIDDLDGGAPTVNVDAWNGSTWDRVLTGVAIGAKVGIEVSGLAAGAIVGIKFRTANTGETVYTESNAVATFNTVAPVLSSVATNPEQNTLTFIDNVNDTADTFTIKWGFASGVLTETPITGVTSPYIHTGLTNGTEYFYEVVAIKGGLESTASAELSGTPSAILFQDDYQLGPVGAFNQVTREPLAGSYTQVLSAEIVAVTGGNYAKSSVDNDDAVLFLPIFEPYTLIGNLKFTSISVGAFINVLSRHESGVPDKQIALIWRGNGELQIKTGSTILDSTTLVPVVDQEYVLKITDDDTTMTVYVDGVEKLSAAGAAKFADAIQFRVSLNWFNTANYTLLKDIIITPGV